MLNFKCNCGTEIINIDRDIWVVDKGKRYNIEFHFAIFYCGSSSTLWQRLRYCWKILTTGQGYSDQVILDEPEAQRLAAELTKYTSGQSIDRAITAKAKDVTFEP